MTDKKAFNGLPQPYCQRGDECKRLIVAEFILHPVAHLKLLPGQLKTSYSGYSITDQYYCFSFTARKNEELTDSFLWVRSGVADIVM